MEVAPLIFIFLIKAVTCNFEPNLQNIANQNGIPLQNSMQNQIQNDIINNINPGNIIGNNVGNSIGLNNLNKNIPGNIRGIGELGLLSPLNMANDNLFTGNLGGNFPGSIANANIRNIRSNNAVPNVGFINNYPNKNLPNNLLNNFSKLPNMAFPNQMTKLLPTDVASIVNMAANRANPFANTYLDNPYGLQVQSDGLEIAGTVAVNGKMPILGTVGFQGSLPSGGVGTVTYQCY